MTRLTIPKTYKLYIGGAFPRSESGRTYEVMPPTAPSSRMPPSPAARTPGMRSSPRAPRSPAGRARRPTTAARCCTASPSCSDGRRAQFVDELSASEGISAAAAGRQVDEAVDAWVWYAGWCDKYAQVAGAGNPVSGPYFNISVPEPTGVVAIVAPQGPESLLGFVAVVAPALVAGNTVVVIANQAAPLSAISLAEVLATSDVPGGVVNILTGSPAEIAPWLAAHADVNALDLTGADTLDWISLQSSAADTLKRVITPETGTPARSLDRILAFTETKTIWHTKSRFSPTSARSGRPDGHCDPADSTCGVNR